MDVPKTYNFSKTKAVLAEIQNVLKCHVCKVIIYTLKKRIISLDSIFANFQTTPVTLSADKI